MMRTGFKLVQRARVSAVRALSATAGQKLSYPVISKEDFGAYKEYSVIHTDRSLNLMSDPFQRVMRDLNNLLKVTYNCDKVAIIPGTCGSGWWCGRPDELVRLTLLRVFFSSLFKNDRIGNLWNGSGSSSVCHQ